MVKLKMLPALCGDCIMLHFLEKDFDYMMIVDSGMGRNCIRKLRSLINNRSVDSAVDLWVLTHIDSDHISGILYLLRDDDIDGNVIKEIWFNYGKGLDESLQVSSNISLSVENVSNQTSFRQATELYTVLQKRNIYLRAPITSGDVYKFGEIKVTILLPSVEQLKKLISTSDYQYENDDHGKKTASRKSDYSYSIEELTNKKFSETNVTTTNASSIALLLEYKDFSILLLGDAKASDVVDALVKMGFSEKNRLRVGYCKIAHHGSAYNTSDELLKMIDCKNYLISSNWRNGKPSKECLSRIVVHFSQKVNFYCNYEPYPQVFSVEEQEKYGMKLIFLNDKEFIAYGK